MSYSPLTPLDSSLVAAHPVALSVLTPGTLYHYRVRSSDAAGNPAVSADFTFLTLPPPDTTPPTVSIITPATNSSVSGTVAVSAAASDNVGLAGVQFKLDNINIGSEFIAVPYALTWDTTGAPNGSHTLTTLARDAAGNTTTSAAVTVTVHNDLIPPVLSGVTASSIGPDAAAITWATNEPSDSQVEYGLTTSYSTATLLATSLVTAHSATLNALSAGNPYEHHAKSQDASR